MHHLFLNRNVMNMSMVLLLGFASVSIRAQEFPELFLNEILTKEEQNEIGVHKLNGAERENLRILLIRQYLIGYEQGQEEGIELTTEYFLQAATNYEELLPSSDVIESQIDGEYEGWEGETILKLMNGQIWQQSEYYYEYHYAFMPKVMIYKSGIGYKMKVDGVDKAVGVMRIK